MAKTMTAPLAIVKIGNETVGKMRSLRITETFRRADVRGLGEVTSQEKPIVAWDGTITASAYTLSMDKIGTILQKKFGINRNTGDVKKFVNTVLLNELPIDLYIYKKGSPTIDEASGVVTDYEEEDFAVVRAALTDNMTLDLTEGNVSGQDISMTYLNPIIFDEAQG